MKGYHKFHMLRSGDLVICRGQDRLEMLRQELLLLL